MKNNSIAGIVLLGLLVLAVLGTTVFVVKAYRSPLGPALQAATPTSMPQPVDTQAAPAVAPAVDASLVCGENAVWNVLVLGSDASDLFTSSTCFSIME